MFETVKPANIKYFDQKNKLSSFGNSILKSAQKAALESIAQHKAAGNPIYFKEKGMLIKELADGTQYLVRVSKNGIETIRKL